MDNQQGPPVQPMELCSVLRGSLDRRGFGGRMDTCIRMAQSLHCSPKTIRTLLISYTPIQNKKCKIKFWSNISQLNFRWFSTIGFFLTILKKKKKAGRGCSLSIYMLLHSFNFHKIYHFCNQKKIGIFIHIQIYI